MKKIVLLVSLTSYMVAQSYYAKIQPVNSYSIKSNVSGKVILSNVALEGEKANNSVVVKIDSASEKNDIVLTREKLTLQNALVRLNHEIFLKKQSYYATIKTLKSKSSLDKDNAFYAQAGAKVQYLSSQSQAHDLQQRVFTLAKTIQDKTIHATGLIQQLFVKKGDFVTMGTPIMEVVDTRKAKLTFYISSEDAKTCKTGLVTVDGVNIPKNAVKVWKVSDTKHVSMYKAEIIIDAPILFSTLAKINITKNE